MTADRPGMLAVARAPQLPAILASQLISLLGSVGAQVALTVLIYRRTQSPLLSSLVLASAFVPQLLGASLTRFVQHLPTRGLLVGCDLASAGLVGLMLVPRAPIALLLGLTALVGVLTPVYGGTRAATLGRVLDGDAWVVGRSLLRLISQSSVLTGLALGGVLLTVITPRTLLAVDAVSFVASAVLLRLGTRAQPGIPPTPRQPGIGGPWRERQLWVLTLLEVLPPCVISAVDGLAAAYVGQRHGSAAGVGLLLAAASVGSVLGEVLGIRLRVARRPRLLLPLALLTCLPLIAYATSPSLPVAAALDVLAGLGFAYGQGVDARLLPTLAEADRPAVLGRLSSVLMAAQGIAAAAAGAAAELLAPAWVLTIASGLGVLAVLVLVRQLAPLPGPAQTVVPQTVVPQTGVTTGSPAPAAASASRRS